MKTKTLYICDFCGDEFCSPDECSQHEAMHRRPYDVEFESTPWLLQTYNGEAMGFYPRFVHVEFDDGAVIRYNLHDIVQGKEEPECDSDK